MSSEIKPFKRADAANRRSPPSRSHDPWVRDGRRRIVSGNLDNIRTALKQLGVIPTYDRFAREIRLNGLPVDDLVIERLWVQIVDTFAWQPSRPNLHSVINHDAHARATHPVLEYLDQLTWDKTPRLDHWLITHAGADDTKYVQAVSSRPLIAAVRRVRWPGTKFDELPILEGSQGTQKSSAVRALCPNEAWFSDDLPLGVDSKQVIERTGGKLLIEASELHGRHGIDTEALKAFLSRSVDGPVRPAYGRFSVTVPRQFVLIGTTNRSSNYLRDPTGARRFWPVSTRGNFDVSGLERHRDQLWAEAAAREAAGESIRLDPSLWSDAGAQQESRRLIDPWEPILEPLFRGSGLESVDAVPVSAVWEALKLEASHCDNRAAGRVARIAERHGFIGKARKWIGDHLVWHWVKSRADDVQDRKF